MTFKKGEKPPGKKKSASKVQTRLVAAPSPATPVVEASPAPHNTGIGGAPVHPAQYEAHGHQPTPPEPFKDKTIIFPVQFAAMHRSGHLMSFSKGQRVTITKELDEFLKAHGFNL